jgi:MFS family permease
MYQIENSGQVIKSRKSLTFARLRVSRVVLFLGLTSFFTDISSEMITTILPIYLIFSLHLAPIEFGIIDGLYQGAAALVRIASGILSDRWQRYKEIAIAGYSLSAICKLGFLILGSAWAWIAGIILVDRIGKGIRTSPRDALISLNSPHDELAAAFGVHRALDTAGAMLGPLVAFGLLALTPGAFDTVFVVSFCIALIGLGVLTLFVDQQPAKQRASHHSSVSLRTAMSLLNDNSFRALVLIGGLLGLTTISDSFVYLSIQQRLDLNVGFFPLLYVITALVYMLLAVPAGWLADRIGRGRVFVGGYALLLAVYTLLLLPSIGWFELGAYLFLFGAYYSATDGVLMAFASARLPQHLRASGLSLLTTVTSLARLLASVLFGLFWTLWGVETTVRAFLGLLLVALVIAVFVVTHIQRATPDAQI